MLSKELFALREPTIERIHNALVADWTRFYEERQAEWALEREKDLKNKNKKFDFKDFIIPRLRDYHGEEVVDGYKFFVPSKTKDLLDAGSALSICVGSESFEIYMKKGVSCIFMLQKDGKFTHCLEVRRNFNRFYFKQAVGYGNKDMDSALKKAVAKKLGI